MAAVEEVDGVFDEKQQWRQQCCRKVTDSIDNDGGGRWRLATTAEADGNER